MPVLLDNKQALKLLQMKIKPKTQMKKQKQYYSSYAYGTAAATVVILATAALARHYKNKKLSDDYVRA